MAPPDMKIPARTRDRWKLPSRGYGVALFTTSILLAVLYRRFIVGTTVLQPSVYHQLTTDELQMPAILTGAKRSLAVVTGITTTRGSLPAA